MSVDSDSSSEHLELSDAPLLTECHDHDDLEADLGFIRRYPSFQCSKSGLLAWCKGPEPPLIHRIRPIFPRWQAIPQRLVHRWLPRGWMKTTALLSLVFVWMIVFFSFTQRSLSGEDIPGYGEPIKLTCYQRLWDNATNCGVDGQSCRPFEGKSFAFRCPSGCAAAILLEPHVVGEFEYNYRPLVVGGSTRDSDSDAGLYRGDSSICASALHAGLIDDFNGGCAILHRHGEHAQFGNITQNDITSLPFMPHFPLSFNFSKVPSSSSCSDIRWRLFAFTLVVTSIISMTATSSAAFFGAVFFMIWTQIAMASDPPATTFTFYDLLSPYLSRFVPGAFVGLFMYMFWIKLTLGGLNAPLERTVLWLGGCWVGALNTDTFDRIPIARLTPHDLQQQPGAVTALIIIISSLVAIALLQAYCFQREGRFFPMLRLYGLFISGLLLLLLVPHTHLRIHHDLHSQLLIPGTSMQTRPSLLFQGILVGLYINGVTRWGFGAILQTPAFLLDDAKLGTEPPVVHKPRVEDENHLVFSFPDLPAHVDGISVQVNDVLRFQGVKPEDGQVLEFDWRRRFENEIEYFRFAYLHMNVIRGAWFEDFTDAIVWQVNGSFTYPSDWTLT